MIMGRKLLQELGIDILNSEKKFRWDKIEVDMVPKGHWTQSNLRRWSKTLKFSGKEESELKKIDECHLAKILANDNYEETDLDALVDNQTHLSGKQKEYLLEGLR